MFYSYSEFSSNKEVNKESLEKTKGAIQHVIDNLDQEEFAFFKTENFCNLEETRIIADKIKNNFEYLIILGMGGSILNPMAILPFGGDTEVEIIGMDCIDPFYFREIADNIDIEKTAFLTISKSGDTVETLALYKTWLEFAQEANIDIAKHFYFIAGKGDNIIRNEAKKYKCSILDHHANIGGRFASFTNVSLLSGMVAGVDVESLLVGAKQTLEDFLTNKERSDVGKAVSYLSNMHALGKNVEVNIVYMNHLIDLVEWYAQIVAESLGKVEKGFTPTKARGPLDHHSQLQLYVDGPKDKFYTLFYHDEELTDILPDMKGHNLEGKSLYDLMSVKFTAFKEVLAQNNLPFRVFKLSKIDARSLGALIMHLNLEIIVTGFALDIQPFGQPGVESIKEYTKKLLPAA